MSLSEELQWRGFVNQTTYADMSALDKAPLTFYFGVDPSADSMTIGNLASAMMVRHFIDAGHTAYLLVGGATGLIGDPDGKKEERTIQTTESVAHNAAAIARQYETIFAGQPFKIVNNYDWFKDCHYIDFLRTVGKNVPMSQMLGRDFIQSRLGADGSGISYAEFSYSLIQAYDFWHLFRTYGVTLQLCGADQWGNAIAGVDLIRRVESAEANVYSTPLIINASTGKKFGKSEDGAVWLDPAKTSVYRFYQFWLNVDDASTAEYAKIFTLLDKAAIDAMTDQIVDDPKSRQAQKTLAREVTLIVHGQERTDSVERVTNVLFGGQMVQELSADDLAILAEEIPTAPLNTSISEILVRTTVASSGGNAKRLIESGAVSLNGHKILADQVVSATSLLKKGKNSFILVR